MVVKVKLLNHRWQCNTPRFEIILYIRHNRTKPLNSTSILDGAQAQEIKRVNHAKTRVVARMRDLLRSGALHLVFG